LSLLGNLAASGNVCTWKSSKVGASLSLPRFSHMLVMKGGMEARESVYHSDHIVFRVSCRLLHPRKEGVLCSVVS